MKSLILVGVIGVLVGLGGGAGLSFALAPAVAADSATVHADSMPDDSVTIVQAPHDAVAADTAAHLPAARDSAPALVVKPPVDSASPPASVATAPSVRTGADSAPPDSIRLRRISRIFAAMAPREAAKVLQQLEDADVITIVGSLNEKQAAAVLTAMPPERAAIISRGSMRPQRSRTP